MTRKMNQRISFLSNEQTQNDDGDLINVPKVHFACWAEVPKATTKEFRDRETNKIEEIQKRKKIVVFYIRKRKEPIDTAWEITWRGNSYRIKAVEDDWQSLDMDMISGELIE